MEGHFSCPSLGGSHEGWPSWQVVMQMRGEGNTSCVQRNKSLIGLMPAQQSRNHHWLPRCLMRPWEGANDNLVTAFSRQPWGLSVMRRSTKSLGSEMDLHTVEILDKPDILEGIFGKIEGSFSVARDRAFAGGVGCLSADDREIIAFFVAFLKFRHPDALKSSSAQSSNDFALNLKNVLPAADPSLAAYVSNEVGTYIALKAATEFSYSLVPNITGLEWRIVDFSGMELKLVLADQPLRFSGKGGAIENFTLPIGPNHLLAGGVFPASQSLMFADEFKDLLAARIVSQQFRQAVNFVVAHERAPYEQLAGEIMGGSIARS